MLPKNARKSSAIFPGFESVFQTADVLSADADTHINSKIFPVDITDERSFYLLKADLPRVLKENITVTVSDKALHILVENTETITEKDDKGNGVFVKHERSTYMRSRKFSFPEDVDLNSVKCEFSNRVLTAYIFKSSGDNQQRVVDIG